MLASQNQAKIAVRSHKAFTCFVSLIREYMRTMDNLALQPDDTNVVDYLSSTESSRLMSLHDEHVPQEIDMIVLENLGYMNTQINAAYRQNMQFIGIADSLKVILKDKSDRVIEIMLRDFTSKKKAQNAHMMSVLLEWEQQPPMDAMMMATEQPSNVISSAAVSEENILEPNNQDSQPDDAPQLPRTVNLRSSPNKKVPDTSWNSFPDDIRSFLDNFIASRIEAPYYSHNEHQLLCKLTALSHSQVKHYFQNTRDRRMKYIIDLANKGIQLPTTLCWPGLAHNEMPPAINVKVPKPRTSASAPSPPTVQVPRGPPPPRPPMLRPLGHQIHVHPQAQPQAQAPVQPRPQPLTAPQVQAQPAPIRPLSQPILVKRGKAPKKRGRPRKTKIDAVPAGAPARVPLRMSVGVPTRLPAAGSKSRTQGGSPGNAQGFALLTAALSAEIHDANDDEIAEALQVDGDDGDDGGSEMFDDDDDMMHVDDGGDDQMSEQHDVLL